MTEDKPVSKPPVDTIAVPREVLMGVKWVLNNASIETHDEDVWAHFKRKDGGAGAVRCGSKERIVSQVADDWDIERVKALASLDAVLEGKK